MAWVPVSSRFTGGSEELKALSGKKIRARRTQQFFGYDGVAQSLTLARSVAMGQIAFISAPHGATALIVVPEPGVSATASLANLTRFGRFFVLTVSWNELANGFELEV